MEFCQICLEKVSKELMLRMSCGCQACIECSQNWAISQINDEKTYVRCPFANCALMLSNLEEFLTPETLTKLLDNQANLYLNHNPSIKKCPRPGCRYAGFIYKHPEVNYFCETCNECWEEPQENFGSTLFKVRRCIEEIFNIIWKALFCKTCSGCQIFIEKNQGCRHIDCTMCGTDFCWFCKQSYKTHQQIQCSSNVSEKIFYYMCYFTAFMVGVKIVMCFSLAYFIVSWVLYVPFMMLYVLFIKIFFGVVVCNMCVLVIKALNFCVPYRFLYWIFENFSMFFKFLVLAIGNYYKIALFLGLGTLVFYKLKLRDTVKIIN